MHIRLDLKVVHAALPGTCTVDIHHIPAYTLDYITAVKVLGLKSGFIFKLCLSTYHGQICVHTVGCLCAVVSAADWRGTGLHECNITKEDGGKRGRGATVGVDRQ